MSIEFACDTCGAHVRIPEPKPGGKYRCPKCQTKVVFRANNEAKSSVIAASKPINALDRPTRTLRILLLILVIVVIGVGGTGYYGYTSNKKKTATLKSMERLSEDQILRARERVKAYAFSEARDVLREVEAQVSKAEMLNEANKEILLDRLTMFRTELEAASNEYEAKLAKGYKLIDGRLVSPEAQAHAIAEQKRRKVAERQKLLAEAKAREEKEANERARREAEQKASEEREGQRLEKEEAQRELKKAIRDLPALQKVLDGAAASDRFWLLSCFLSMQLAATKSEQPDLNEYLIDRDEVIGLIEKPGPHKTALVRAYRDEILDLVRNLDCKTYLRNGKSSKVGAIPFRFAIFKDEPTLILGTVFSDTQFNNVNQSVNTPKKRAAAFTQRTVLPVLLSCRPTDRLKSTKLPYFGVLFAYAHKNFVKEKDTPEAELLCIVMATKDFAAFADRDLTQEALLRSAAVFIASGPNFVRVELSLE